MSDYNKPKNPLGAIGTFMCQMLVLGTVVFVLAFLASFVFGGG